MRKLYEIDKDIELCIMEGTDYETGEFRDFDKLNELQMERETKLENVALFIKDSRAEADAIQAEISRLDERMEKLLRNADGAEHWLAEALKGEKFSTSKVECTFRKSTVVEVDKDFCQYAYSIGQYMFLTHHETDTPNRAKIKEFLKNGGQLEHCKLVEKNNITVR